MNFHGTKEYLDIIKGLDERIFSKVNMDTPDRVRELRDGYIIKYYYYVDEENCSPDRAPEDGEICRLYKETDMLYEWKNIDGRSRMAEIIDHSDGNRYLIFDEDLYGYSVLNIASGECMHYIPAKSHTDRKDGKGCEETFIWCDCRYNPENDYLAVEGCIWACPYGIILVDFSEPMKAVESEEWIDVGDLCADGSQYEQDDDIGSYDIEFMKWEGNNVICRSDIVKAPLYKTINDKLKVKIVPNSMVLYELMITDTELSYNGYSEDFMIGVFRSEREAKSTAEDYLKEIAGFNEFPCVYRIESIEVAGGFKSDEVWCVWGYNYNEKKDEVDTIKNFFGSEDEALSGLEEMKNEYLREEWGIDKYIIGEKHWTEGFCRQ